MLLRRTGWLIVALALMWPGPPAANGGQAGRALVGQEVDQSALFRATGRLFGLDPDLLRAIALVESGGRPDAISPKGALGLMQLMPVTAERFGVTDPLDPISNLLGAARFLVQLKRLRLPVDGAPLTLPEVLAAYNAGEGAMRKYGGIPPYPETRKYVRKVLTTYLFADADKTRSANRLRPPQALPQKVLTGRRDPLAKLTEIRRLRALALRRQRSARVSVEPR